MITHHMSSLASQPAYAHARAKVGGEREGKIAPAQYPEPTNQIAATRKLRVNWFPPRPLMIIRQGSEF